MNRENFLEEVSKNEEIWDIIIIGGGATGVGCALDSASRGLRVLLLEQSDFGKGTSSRSTKLVHGGVRYLAQGNFRLVKEALRERGILQKNAPHLVEKTAFVIPCYSNFSKLYYGFGLKFYDLLSKNYSFGKSRFLSKEQTVEMLPNVKTENLAGGIVYYDGQFDDARLLINLLQTAVKENAICLNYTRVFGFLKDDENKIVGVNFVDEESGQLFQAKGKVVINATGVFVDQIRQMAEAKRKPLVKPSQGVHLTFAKEFLPSKNALMIPQTSDGRVLFAIPWHGKVVVGTTDTALEKPLLEPQALAEEIDFILQTAEKYLVKKPRREDILSVFVGIRPLVDSSNSVQTASLSRDHTILVENSNLLTITGGKWTIYRKMAEDCIDKAIELGNLKAEKCLTEEIKIRQSPTSDSEKLHPDLPYTKEDVRRAVKEEMALNLEDVLARRTRCLFLNAQASIEIAPQVAEIMANELQKDKLWQTQQLKLFKALAEKYCLKSE